MDDLISRQAAIDAVNRAVTKEAARWSIEYLPSAQPERKGRWIHDETDNSIECDKCGCTMWANDLICGDAFYCPNCGAEMRGGQHDMR